MQKIILTFFICSIYVVVVSQNDTLKPQPHFEPIFGSNCDGDTLERTLFNRHDDVCRLNRKTLVLERLHNNKTSWKINLSPVQDTVYLWNPCLFLIGEKWIVVQANNLNNTILYTIWVKGKSGKIKNVQFKTVV